MMKATVEQLQGAIARECAYQVGKWGDRQLTLAGWLLVAESELDEAIEAWVRGKWDKEAKAELLQMVTVGHRWLEQWKVGSVPHEWSVIQGALKPEHPIRAFEEWLGILKGGFPRAWEYVAQDRLYFGTLGFAYIVRWGESALLQHGIVERGEL